MAEKGSIPAPEQENGTTSHKELEEKARKLRLDILEMTYKAGSGHPGGSMSAAELFIALYYKKLRHDPKNPKWEDRDRFILSKGHCCPGQYQILSEFGYFPRDELWKLRQVSCLLQGHPSNKIPGIDMASGSLGQGLSFANGVALAAKLDGKSFRTYVMLGDGECQEGQVWEAAMTTPFRKLDNVCAILDYNKIQIDGFVKDVKAIEPIADKWRAFGWHVVEIDGHSFPEILAALDEAEGTKEKPTIIIAHTLKGKGVSFMENKADYHGRALKPDEMKKAFEELGQTWEVIGNGC